MDSKYFDYLQSKKWRKKKLKLKRSVNHKQCMVCYSPKKIHVHHLTYKHIFDEKLNELNFLCKKHHAQIHDIIKEMKIFGKEALAQLRQEYQREILIKSLKRR